MAPLSPKREAVNKIFWSKRMTALVSIREVAKAMDWTYHQARNRLRKNAEASKLAHKVGHAVCYEKSVLEVIRAAS
jgi:hypothetical protein